MFPLDLTQKKELYLFCFIVVLLILLITSSSIAISDYNALLSVQDDDSVSLSSLGSVSTDTIPTLQTALLQLQASNGYNIFVLIVSLLTVLSSVGVLVYDKFVQ